MTIGEQIRKFRLKRGFTQQYLAELIGVEKSKKQRISDIENDRVNPSLELLKVICEALECELILKQLK